jgi:hypothetical protein
VVLYYALGGGLGHLTRARTVLGALGLDDAVLLTASPYARDRRVTNGRRVVEPPGLERDAAACRRWIESVLARLCPDEMIVDSFPGGIVGELCGASLPPARHIARRLRWDRYARRLSGALPPFTVSYLLEPLAPAHTSRLADCSNRLSSLELPPLAQPPASGPLVPGPHWLVVHSGPDAEVVDLARYAAELRSEEGAAAEIVVVSPRRPSSLPPGSTWRNVYPARAYFPHADRIVTAAGFNAMRETEPMRERHRFVPYPRPLDDQFGRAAAAREVA